MKKVCIIHGPNLNFTGIREKSVYGTKSHDDFNKMILEKCDELGFEAETFQSNHEGAIIDKLQECYFKGVDGIVINPGAFTHYSYAIRDAISSINAPVIEVHISNVHKREEFRHKSVTAPVCAGQICGLGTNGYLYALEELCDEQVR